MSRVPVSQNTRATRYGFLKSFVHVAARRVAYTSTIAANAARTISHRRSSERSSSTTSEHAVRVRGLLGNVLPHVPVLDDLAVLELEDVHDGGAPRPGLADGVDVQDHEVSVGERALDLAVRRGKLLPQELQERLEPFGAVGGGGIVLRVPRAQIFRRGREVL